MELRLIQNFSAAAFAYLNSSESAQRNPAADAAAAAAATAFTAV